jgi:hypothetical protein
MCSSLKLARHSRKGAVTGTVQNKVQSTFESLLASGELLESSRFREQVGWTRRALTRAVLAGRVFYIEVGGVRAFPAFYLDRRYRRMDLEAVTALLGTLSSGSKWLFFTTQKASLARAGAAPCAGQAPAAIQARTPLQALEDGDLDRVQRAAAGFAGR